MKKEQREGENPMFCWVLLLEEASKQAMVAL